MKTMIKAKSAEGDRNVKLFISDEKSYGKDYKTHLLTQYKLCVEMADKISSRRSTANNFFLSVNTVLISAIGILLRFEGDLVESSLWWLVVTSVAGILFCWAWWINIRCYRGLNEAKFKVINAIEERLPVSAFSAEWALLNPKDRTTVYPQLTKIERWVPTIFAFLYSVLMLIGISSILLPSS